MTLERGSLPRAGIAMGLAALVHASAFAWVLQSLERPGAISRQTAAISLNLVETLVVEAPAARETPETSAANIEAVAKPHPVDRPEVAPETSKTKAEERNETRRETLVDVDVTAAPPERQKEEIKTSPRKTGTHPPARSPTAKKSTGPAKSRGTVPARRSEARVSASRGEVSNYSALVRTRIAQKRPTGRGIRGTVIVAFAISTSGGLRYARIDGSSGNTALDRAALAAVRRAAPFPDPPLGMSLRQLSYTLPFRFK